MKDAKIWPFECDKQGLQYRMYAYHGGAVQRKTRVICCIHAIVPSIRLKEKAVSVS